VRELEIAAGAGFIVALTGKLVRMPGLGRRPQSENVDLVDGEIVGIG
jgi:formate--tetrahydrofolate ligase